MKRTWTLYIKEYGTALTVPAMPEKTAAVKLAQVFNERFQTAARLEDTSPTLKKIYCGPKGIKVAEWRLA